MGTRMTNATGSWPDAIFRELSALEVRQVAYVPDAGHTRLITLCAGDAGMRAYR